MISLQKIERAMLKQVSDNDNPTDLENVSKIYGEEAERRRKAGQRHQGYELVKEAAEFKARVQALATKRAQLAATRRQSRLSKAFLLSARFLDEQDFLYNNPRWEFQNGDSTVAFDIKASLVRYIVSTPKLLKSMKFAHWQSTGVEVLCRLWRR